MPHTAPQVWLLPALPEADGFDAPGWVVHALEPRRSDHHGPRALLVGTVDGPERAAIALGAVAAGTSVAIRLDVVGAARQRLLEDLGRLGVEPRDGWPTPPEPTGAQRALLELLAAGSTVSAAAHALHLSRRTANRMLEEARALLGVQSNAEAIRAWAGRQQ